MRLAPLLLFTALLSYAAASGRAASVQVEIRHRSGAEPLVMDELRYRNVAGEEWSVSRLSYLVSGISLLRADGSWFSPRDSVAWMNAATRRQTVRLGNVPAGRYEALRFYIGIDPADNASDPSKRAPDHPLNPNLCGLHWSWQGGYIFMALEGLHRSGKSGPEGYAFHLARDAFRTEVMLKLDLNLQDELVIPVNFNVASILDGAVGVSFVRDGTTTHSREGDPLALVLKRNLADAFSLDPEIKMPQQKKLPPAAVTSPQQQATSTPVQLAMGAQFPQPALPTDNPLTAERVALGGRLFHETALSRDGSITCASCHEKPAARSDPRRFSIGVAGGVGDRNAMPLFNLAWKREFFWDGRAPSLRAQVLVPIQDHREMGESLDAVVAKLRRMEAYPLAFERAFGSKEITVERLSLALENFLLTLTSHDSKFDRAMRGEGQLSADEKRGFDLFMTEREPRMGSMGGDCFHCHGGALFTDHQFRNNGLAISEADPGRSRVTGSRIDRGAFATPSLRNIALTAPYMHDGRFNTLEEVLDHYSEGVKRIETLDANLAKHPDGGLHLSPEDKRDIIAFLRTLTDTSFAPTN